MRIYTRVRERVLFMKEKGSVEWGRYEGDVEHAGRASGVVSHILIKVGGRSRALLLNGRELAAFDRSPTRQLASRLPPTCAF
jgi:hypothetical protein